MKATLSDPDPSEDREKAISYAEEQLTRTGKGRREAVTVMAASDTVKSEAVEAGAPGRRGPPTTDTAIVVQKNTQNGGGGGG
jgi:hypothetical protein